jgi:hypothetical protein
MSARRPGQFHQASTDALALIGGINEQLGYRSEEVSIGENANGSYDARSASACDVQRACESFSNTVGVVVTRPDPLRQVEKLIRGHPSIVDSVLDFSLRHG